MLSKVQEIISHLGKDSFKAFVNIAGEGDLIEEHTKRKRNKNTKRLN